MCRSAWALLLVLAACKRPAEEEVAAGPRRVECILVTTRSTQDGIEVRGTVVPLPDRDAQVAAQIAGRLLGVEVREGEEVKKGQLVARVEAAALEDSARQAEAALSRATAEALNAETTQKRVAHVVERGIAPRQEADDAVAKLASAKAAAVEAEASARQAHRQVERALVKSPLDGVVLKVLRQTGELVDGTPATAVVEIADVTQLELAADVPAQDLVRLSRGAVATVVFPGMPDAGFSARVSMVSPSVDRATGLGMVRVRLDSSQAKLPPIGLFGTARIALGEAHEVKVIPAAALRNMSGKDAEVVVCGADHLLHVQKVQVGATAAGEVEVTGLPADARVAVQPVIGLADGEAFEAR